MTSYAAVDLIAQRTANTTEQGIAHTAEAPATREVVGCGRHSRGLSFPFGTLHQSCACTHRHRTWFLFCLSSQPTCDFILRRQHCLCFSLGTVLVLMVGRSSGLSVWHRVGGSTRGASYTLSPSDTYFSGRFHNRHLPVRAATFWHVCFEMEPNPGACRRRSTERSLSARCALGAR